MLSSETMDEFVTEEEEPWYDQQDLEQGKTSTRLPSSHPPVYSSNSSIHTVDSAGRCQLNALNKEPLCSSDSLFYSSILQSLTYKNI